MKIKKIQSSWLEKNGYRLDCNPYMSGSVEAIATLESISCRKDLLSTLTAGHDGGIYNGPKFSRTWAKNQKHGVPFMGSASMQHLDLNQLPLLSKKLASTKKLSYLEIKPGTTLISCSGTIGRMVYSREDMRGIWSSQHIMKVVPNEEKINSGYLFSFLNSKYGVPLVVSGTYGSIIQSIEPKHIKDVPVPRLGLELERKVHNLVKAAADLRVEASKKLSKVSDIFDQHLPKDNYSYPKVTAVGSRSIQSRFDAQFHDPEVSKIKTNISSIAHVSIGEWCHKIFLPGIFKRIHIDTLEHGAYYYTGAALFTLEPQPKGILSRQTSKFGEVYLEKGMILVQAFGQDGGLTGRSVWVGEHLDKQTTTHMLVRLQSDNLKKDAFLFGFLQSDLAYKQIACLTYGGSIPHFDEAGISTVLMPLFDENTFNQIADDVLWAVDARDRALENEKRARRLVEEAIDEMVAG
ncbi:methylation-associated defense system restriction endonuclease subunit S MAD5 [Vibrio lentus]|uniref:methylation-associated defense system restriction endonuclease subunit S MAD5 n=1 Tax=Vibrio lentus TaxID=136468 RepID=UPI000C82788C|nr:restriction endonuclease subunit S [Vibrio lentus]PMH08662.1 hypothetical protein BCU76_04780 [Vibrio lentus]